jgi:hypothetical protein
LKGRTLFISASGIKKWRNETEKEELWSKRCCERIMKEGIEGMSSVRNESWNRMKSDKAWAGPLK